MLRRPDKLVIKPGVLPTTYCTPLMLTPRICPRHKGQTNFRATESPQLHGLPIFH